METAKMSKRLKIIVVSELASAVTGAVLCCLIFLMSSWLPWDFIDPSMVIYLNRRFIPSLVGGLACGIAVPLLVIAMMGSSRQKLLADQGMLRKRSVVALVLAIGGLGGLVTCVWGTTSFIIGFPTGYIDKFTSLWVPIELPLGLLALEAATWVLAVLLGILGVASLCLVSQAFKEAAPASGWSTGPNRAKWRGIFTFVMLAILAAVLITPFTFARFFTSPVEPFVYYATICILIPVALPYSLGIVVDWIILKVFIKVKNRTKKDYKNGILPGNVVVLTGKKLLGRFFTLFLFCIPLIELARTYIPQSVLFYQGQRFGGIENMLYVALIIPFVFFLFSTTWAIEDANLMHYSLGAKDAVYFEVEPMHFRLSDFLKGYAGISAIIALVNIYITDLSPWLYPFSSNLFRAVLMLLIWVFGAFCYFIILYWFYAYVLAPRMHKKMVSKLQLKPMRRVTEDVLLDPNFRPETTRVQ
jgi:hypothetical protein